ncbi:hypothetical protein [Nevskia sp.]|uniref:hypothetical protein n=1 Tax=Nevskia sp. TaxID=1929292 RepID=UPI0025FA6B6E|nr:hypothetical protein [Nevskia sp.]
MQMRPQIQIQSVIKALSDVVLPAIDPNNKLAIEQGKLSIGLLALLAQQLPNQFRFDCDELARLIATARELVAQAKGGKGTQAAVAALYEATQLAGGTLDAAQASPADVEAMVRALRVTSGQLVTEVYRDGEAGCRAGIRDAVLAMSKEQLLRDRSMLLMQGWEPDPKAVPSIASLLDASAR